MKTNGPQTTLRYLILAAVALFCLQMFSDNKADVDIWGNVGFVKAVPWSDGYHRTNTFSYTEPDRPWVNHEWGGEYIFHLIYSSMGNTGLLILKVLLGFSSLLIMNASMRKDCRSIPVRILLLLLVVSTMGYGYSMRPHHFTYLMLALYVFCLRHHGESRLMMLVFLPLLGLLWANLHGAFFIGAVLLAAWGTCELIRTRRLPLAFGSLGLFFVASLVNPYGIRLWEFIGQSAAKTRPYLSEWAMFHPVHDFIDHVDFVVLFFITAVTALASPGKKKDVTWLVILALIFASAVTMRRNIPLFAMICAFVMPQHCDAVFGERLTQMARKLSPAFLIVILALLIPALAYNTAAFNKVRPLQIEIPKDRFPVQARAFIQANHITGNAIVFFDWAEYCIWHLYPDTRVFMDGRFRSAYGVTSINDYLNFIYANNGWDRALDAYDTNMALLHIGNPATKLMAALPGWTKVYADDICCLFLKNDRHADFIEKFKTGKVIQPDARQDFCFP